MFLIDLVYLFAIAALSPWLLWRSLATGRYRSGLNAKLFGRVPSCNPQGKPLAWFHAVSLGEVNLLATLVPAFRNRHPEWKIVVSSTTDSGLSAARSRFADDCVIPWPFDFSWAVATALDTLKPSLIVLTESELWPNFLSAANKRSVPVIAVNARMSPRSFSRLRRFAGLAQRYAFSQMTRFAVQEADYAVRLQQLGVPPEKLAVTGSIKYDGALKERSTTKTEMLRDLLGCGRRDSSETIVWLAGSTHAPEEGIVLSVHSRLRVRFPHLRLILVPRHPDRFEEVARLIVQSGMPHVRRSEIVEALSEMPSVVLLDSLGELGAAWGLADVGFAGGSLDGKRGGQSMIEPAGYGVPCTFGPHVWNFRDAAKRLVEVGGAMMVPDARGLEDALAKLLADPQLRMQMGTAAVNFVRSQQGATARTLEAIDRVIDRSKAAQAA